MLMLSILITLYNAKQKQNCLIREKTEPYVVETVSIWEETRIKFSSASGKYLGTNLRITCLRSEYKIVFPLKRPPAKRFAPMSVWNSSSWTSTSQWAVFFIFSASAYTYYCMDMSRWVPTTIAHNKLRLYHNTIQMGGKGKKKQQKWKIKGRNN